MTLEELVTRPRGRAAGAAPEPGSDLERGLSAAEAAARLRAEGPNVLAARRAASRWRLLAAQFASLVIWVLVGAAVLAGVLGEWVETAVIVTVIVLNALVGFVQEARAEAAIEALRRLTTPRARVLRDGRSILVPAAEVVRGDVLLVEAGDVVAADARLDEAANLEVNEALLTGESLPVAKAPAAPEVEARLAGAPLGERRHLLFAGSAVTRGCARAVVTATGMATELGRIAGLLEGAGQDETPLQRRLDRVSKRLIVAVAAIVALVFALGLLRGEPALSMLLAALSLAVAAIPTGLPTVVTLALAVGARRMARRHALVRRMAAVETLGSAQVVCSDKTGTLTMGELAVQGLWTPEAAFGVTGEGFALQRLLRAAAACNDAELTARDGRLAVVGDPTDGALLVAAAKAGVRREAIEQAEPRAFSLPFDSERKRMTVVRAAGGGLTAYVKGAPDVVAGLCTRVASGGRDAPLDETWRRRIDEAVDGFARQALRVLALAERRLPDQSGGEGRAPGEVERDLTFLGLATLADPPRPEARDAVRRCQGAGIRVVMITGDHPATGAAVAREVGILRAGDAVLSGADLDRLDDEALARAVHATAVYGRVSPEHKLRIVRAFKRAGLIVAMTGDGVNDAPAVREASVGIAMGRSGTEVTRQAADIVVTDDNFASIVNAVEEGRRIFDNIKKTLLYLLAGNTGEILIMLVAGLLAWPLPLLPAQILWINFITDHPPGLSLATEPVDPDALRRPPRPPDAEFADRRFLQRLVLAGSLIALVSLAGFWHGYQVDRDVAAGRSLAFAVLAVSHTTWAFAARSWTRTFWEAGPLTNLRLLAVVLATLAVQAVIQGTPGLAWIFGTTPLTAADWALAAGLGLLPPAVVELSKRFAGRKDAG